MGKRKDFEKVAGVTVFVGKAEEPTDEQRAEYERQMKEQV